MLQQGDQCHQPVNISTSKVSRRCVSKPVRMDHEYLSRMWTKSYSCHSLQLPKLEKGVAGQHLRPKVNKLLIFNLPSQEENLREKRAQQKKLQQKCLNLDNEMLKY